MSSPPASTSKAHKLIDNSGLDIGGRRPQLRILVLKLSVVVYIKLNNVIEALLVS